jgi:uncharacterized protein
MAIGLVLVLYLPKWWRPPSAPPATWLAYFRLLPWRMFVGIGWTLLTWSMSATYACLLTLLAHRRGWPRRLAPLAAVGRMPLTTYLTQSVVCTLLFYSYGLGWYRHVGWTGMLIITIVLFSIQLAVSTWWLTRYRFGPVEWLWRTLSYGKKQPMRLRAM